MFGFYIFVQTGWWYTYSSENMKVSRDCYSQYIYIYGKIKNVPNHQPDKVDGQQTETHGTIQHDVGTKTALRHVSCLAYSRCDLQAPVQFPNKKTCLEYYLPLL